MTTGIYKITNIVNNNAYIGKSLNIEERFKTHRQRAFSRHCKEYDKALYRAFRKYGLNNFRFEILEECSNESLNEREIYYIAKYDTYYNGYNETMGGDGNVDVCGEKHHNHKLTESDVIDIRTRYGNKERKKEVYKLYQDKVSKSGFHKIWNGSTWKGVMDDVYTSENKDFHKHNTANANDENGKTKLSNNDVVTIRTRKKNGEHYNDVYEFYKSRITFKSFLNTWYGFNWKSIIV